MSVKQHTDFTLSNARQFYSSMGNPLGWKGLTIPFGHSTQLPLVQGQPKQTLLFTWSVGK